MQQRRRLLRRADGDLQIAHLVSLFGLSREDSPAALAALKKHLADEKKPARLAIDPERVAAAKELPEALEAAGFAVRVDAKGNITGLCWGSAPLPSGVAGLKRLLLPLAKFTRDPSVLVVKTPEGAEHDITLKKGKVTSNFFRGIEIWNIFRAAFDADNGTAKKRNKAKALNLYEWLTELEPIAAPGVKLLVEQYREALNALPDLLAWAGRIDEIPAACARHSRPASAFSLALSVLNDDRKRPQDAIALAKLQLKLDPAHEDARLFLQNHERERP